MMAGFQPADEPLDMDAGSGIEFVDELPADGRGNWDSAERAILRTFAAELKKHPGRWAKHPLPAPSNMAARSRASRINNGKVRAFGTGFAAVARNGDTYIRYEPPPRVSQLACPHNVPNFGPGCPTCDR